MDIFEQADAFTPSRAVLQEEEEAATSSAASYLRPAVCLWNKRLLRQLYPKGISCGVLVVATCPTSCALLSALPGKQLLGSVLAPGVSLAGNSLGSGSGEPPLPSDKVCAVYTLQPPSEAPAAGTGSGAGLGKGEDDDVLLVCCQYDVPRERALAWARSLLGQVSCRHAVFLGSMAAEQFRGQGDASQEELIFALRTRAAQQKQQQEQRVSKPPVPLLPTGTVVGGLPAALLSHCQLRGVSAELLVMVEMVAEGRPALLESLAAALGALLRDGRGGGAAAAASEGLCSGSVLAAARKGLGLGAVAAACEVYV
ncbi:hypothetical protein PLESTB_001500000 [Pleodorina starrii]|uniref:Proteasome assembly chaperone 1 n=1 Tax=Pleodorina starrii TaxID=330485 RepID=A0A9W6BXY2_9CHLO|nr:hypothetical protein PLESTM_000665400 [Pleodorina starrii]GLC59556.1 hypothetical protein PLESTB_001500000 [Pleodorina starrii]GLC67796.1 hypothetical protein PLESTF_000608300 [Pleodorina starrii]